MSKQRPILFSTPMVQAILEGRKTQTRRTKDLEVTTERLNGKTAFWSHISERGEHFLRVEDESEPGGSFLFNAGKCPYGKPGDVVWVRETWAETTNVENISHWPDRPHKRTDDLGTENPWSAYIYRADGEWNWLDADGFDSGKSRWKPSIFMPKDAARIWLEIVNVRVERLQKISEEDAKAEGIQEFTKDGVGFKYGLDGWHWSCQTGAPFMCNNRRMAFYTLWASINGQESWSANPWVWVVEFKQIQKP